MRDRLYISECHRDGLLKEIENKNILGLNLAKKIDIFFLAVALGLDNPQDFNGKKDGYFQIHNNVGTSEKSMFGSLLLGLEENKDKVDQFANPEINYDIAEKYAEGGFLKLQEKLDAADWNEELLEKRLLMELNVLYEKNVKSNI